MSNQGPAASVCYRITDKALLKRGTVWTETHAVMDGEMSETLMQVYLAHTDGNQEVSDRSRALCTVPILMRLDQGQKLIWLFPNVGALSSYHLGSRLPRSWRPS
jgi:hypothetical protein